MPKTGRRKSSRIEEQEVDVESMEEWLKAEKTYKLLFRETKRLLDNVGTSEEIKVKNTFREATLDSLTRLEDAFLKLTDDGADENFGAFSSLKDECLRMKADMTPIEKISNYTNIIENPKGCATIRLPKIGLPDFGGELHTWLSFKDIFTTSIIKNDTLNDTQRLSYLQSCVKSEAARLIRGFEIKEENFLHAWQSLLDRYENVKELIFAHIKKIFEIKPIKVANSKNLLEIVDTLNESLRNLKTLGLTSDKFTDTIFVFHIQTKLDTETLKQWELQSSSKELSTLKTFTDFLEKQSRGFLASHAATSKSDPKVAKFNILSNNSNVKVVSNYRCPMCSNNHPIFKCTQFNHLNLKDRWEVVRNKKLCANCLKPNHYSKQCISKSRCKNCNRGHHTTLHSYNTEISNNSNNAALFLSASAPITPESKNPVSSMQTSCLSVNATIGCPTLLSTAMIRVKDVKGNFVECRALVDNGSQKTLISKHLQQRLQLKTIISQHSITGINNTRAETSLAETTLHFYPHFRNELFSIQALVVNHVTSNLPNFHVIREEWPHLKNLILADPNFHVSSPVDVLIGADIFFNLIIGNPILGPPGTPSALDTRLGFILSGPLPSTKAKSDTLCCIGTFHISQQLKRFWELEALPEKYPISSDEELCEQMYQQSVTRDETGRYSVGLPLKSNIVIGDTYHLAKRRFHLLESKLAQQPSLKCKYNEFMQEYIDLHHMEPVSYPNISEKVCYLPHHGVLNEHSTTTKLRVVFDGSAKSSSGFSLNDALYTGPKLQTDIFTLLIQFRSFPIALNADIMQMYRQIKIAKDDADLQRIFWRSSPSDTIREFKLVTVSFGLSASPFLALRTLKQLAHDECKNFPEASKILLSNFYIDDLLSGAKSVEEARHIVNQLQALLNKGGFTLRKWSSNRPEVLRTLPSHLKTNSTSVSLSEDSYHNILGVRWNSSSDTLQININQFPAVTSKRSLLSLIARIFDPIGILSPTTIYLKILLQELWKCQVAWDEDLTPLIRQKWENFQDSVPVLKMIHIPRYVKTSPNSICQLVGFADASAKAYSAVIYLRSQAPSGQINVIFLAAKTKVAPIKLVTLPKLELCAALLLSQLVASVLPTMPIIISDIHLWSDSEIVLYWISSEPSKYDSFIAHRVTKIKALTPSATWSHVSSQENPADCASRGILPKQLPSHPLWWTGPIWLRETSLEMHITPICKVSPDDSSSLSTDFSVNMDTITSAYHSIQKTYVDDLIPRYSSFTKLIRVTAWILRFKHNTKKNAPSRTGTLSASELLSATNCLTKVVQSVEFKYELLTLKQQKSLPRNSKLIPLNVFLDDHDILRVGGRLSQNKDIPYEHRHPALLPARHHFTTILINYLHLKHLHAGPQLVLAFLRHKFWIINGRDTIRKILHNCLVCFKLRAKPTTQLMGNLPKERISLIRPFRTVGVDFSGAFFTRSQLPRSKVKFKSYICLFICLATKAIHLELVSDLSTSCFLACFHRFISRRGLPHTIFSDNATNFRGTANYLNQFHHICKDPAVQVFCTDHHIHWKFIPAYAPNFGGLWEASIKLVKFHLLRVLQSSLLTFEQLLTLLCQIEAILNSRPLLPMSNDPNDFQVLTPGHFLIGSPLLDVPSCLTPQDTLPLPTKWKLIQDMRHHFWNRWSNEYLSYLQPRAKWRSAQANFQVGQLVLIHESSSPPLTWKTGRIRQTFPGTDGKVRVLSIQTPQGLITRNIAKVTLLPNQLCSPESDAQPPRPENVASSANETLICSLVALATPGS